MFSLSKVVRTNLFIQYCLTFSRNSHKQPKSSLKKRILHIQHVLVQFRYACYKLTGNYIPETTGNRKRKNVIEHPPVFIFTTCASTDSLRTADAFPVVASLPPKNSEK